MDTEDSIITKESIDRVPCAKILESDLNKVIQRACKSVLDESMTRTDGYKYDEVCKILDINKRTIVHAILGYNGKIGLVYDSDYFEITTYSSRNSLIMIHNHPNNKNLSINDLFTLLTTPSLLGIVAVGNLGGVYYAIKSSRDQNFYTKLGEMISKIASRNKGSKIIDRMTNKILNEGTKYKLKIGYSRRRSLNDSNK